MGSLAEEGRRDFVEPGKETNEENGISNRQNYTNFVLPITQNEIMNLVRVPGGRESILMLADSDSLIAEDRPRPVQPKVSSSLCFWGNLGIFNLRLPADFGC